MSESLSESNSNRSSIHHADLIRAVLDGKTVEFLNTSVRPHRWLGFLTCREAVHAMVTFHDRQYRLKPEPIVSWGFVNVSVGSGQPDPWVQGTKTREEAARAAKGYQRAIVLRLELDPDTLDVISATTEAP